MQVDLRDFNQCLMACNGMDYVFHLAGVKGSPAMTAQQPASFFTNIAVQHQYDEAARRQG